MQNKHKLEAGIVFADRLKLFILELSFRLHRKMHASKPDYLFFVYVMHSLNLNFHFMFLCFDVGAILMVSVVAAF